MRVKIIAAHNDIILDHNQEAGDYENVFSMRIAADTRHGSCSFNVVDTGGCMLWIGQYSLQDAFVLQVSALEYELHTLVAWPPSLGDDFARIYDKHFESFQLPLVTGRNGQTELPCNGGKGNLLLVGFTTDFVSRYGLPVLDIKFPERPRKIIQPKLASAIQQTIYHTNSEPFRQIYLRIKCAEIYLLLAEQESVLSSQGISGDIRVKMEAIDEQIRNNPDKNYSIACLAKMSGLDRERFNRYFKIFYGTTVHHYILTIRMTLSREMITASNKPLKEIAFDLGFKNDANFSEAFRHFFGFPPGQLRKKKKQST